MRIQSVVLENHRDLSIWGLRRLQVCRLCKAHLR
jgi:hypothetical protein